MLQTVQISSLQSIEAWGICSIGLMRLPRKSSLSCTCNQNVNRVLLSPSKGEPNNSYCTVSLNCESREV